MIMMRLMNGSHIVLNSDLIEFVEATPDTVISLSNGKKLMVKESVSEVVDRILDFRARVGRQAEDLRARSAAGEILPDAIREGMNNDMPGTTGKPSFPTDEF
jgi:flagellar protein FlbD